MKSRNEKDQAMGPYTLLQLNESHINLTTYVVAILRLYDP